MTRHPGIELSLLAYTALHANPSTFARYVIMSVFITALDSVASDQGWLCTSRDMSNCPVVQARRTHRRQYEIEDCTDRFGSLLRCYRCASAQYGNKGAVCLYILMIAVLDAVSWNV